jgi:hypothetical protein
MDRDGGLAALFADHAAADRALRRLIGSHFDRRSLSIIGREDGPTGEVLGIATHGDRIRVWGTFAPSWQRLSRLLSGCALLEWPGIGHVIVLGQLVSTLLDLPMGATPHASLRALDRRLNASGLGPDAIQRYATALRAGHLALVARGTLDAVDIASRLLQTTAPEEMDMFVPTPSEREGTLSQ